MRTSGASDRSSGFINDGAQAMLHVRALSETIGPRPSCSPEEQAAAAYAAEQLMSMGFVEVKVEAAWGGASTYVRYSLISGLAAVVTLVALLFRILPFQALALLTQLAAAQAMFSESDFRRNWSRWLIPDRATQNVVARQRPASSARQTIILLAHLDTARTPAFNASRRGQRVYLLLFRGLLVSFIVAALLHIYLAILPGPIPILMLTIAAGLQFSTSLLLLSFERTPFSPGAYDNASGAACVLALANRLQRQPCAHSEVWICLTGCEETGSGGAVNLYHQHAVEWTKPWVINLDQFGYNQIYLRTEEGLLRRYRTIDESIEIAQQVAAGLPEIPFNLRPSQAFSDAAPAYQRGIPAFSFGTSPTAREASTHRHRISDKAEHLSESALAGNLCYIWSLIQELDRRAQETSDG